MIDRQVSNSKQQKHSFRSIHYAMCIELLHNEHLEKIWPNFWSSRSHMRLKLQLFNIVMILMMPALNALLEKKSPSHLMLTLLLLVHFPRALCSPKNILWSRENVAGKDRPRPPSALTAQSAVVIFMRTKFDEFPVHKCTGHIPDHPVSSSIPATAHLSSNSKKKHCNFFAMAS